MSKVNYIFLIIVLTLTFFYDCKSENIEISYGKKVIGYCVFEGKLIIPNKAEKRLKEMGLVNIQDSIPEILVDLKYTTEDNFIGIDFYGEINNAFMQVECYNKLKNAYNILTSKNPGYTFIVYDAVRSTEAQQLMWDSVDVPINIKHWYVANPQSGSIHNYGMALDISIVDSVGHVLDMGTEFDFFGDLAFPENTERFYKSGELSETQYHNRLLLFDIMAQAQFYVSKTEWWHFNASSLNYAKGKYEIFTVANL